MSSRGSLATLILVAAVALVVYMFANADNEYVRLRDRPKPWVPKRQSINYYAWKGPMFVEDFTDIAMVGLASGQEKQQPPFGPMGKALDGPASVCHGSSYASPVGLPTADCDQYTPKDEKCSSCPENSSEFVQGSQPPNCACRNTIENFGSFEGENNPKAEIVPTCGACEIPKYNGCVEGAGKCHAFAMDKCRIPTLTAEDGWYNEYWNSQYRMQGPDKKLGTPGNYAQVTNNNLDAPNNLKSAQMRSIMGDWFCPKDKVSPYCYANTWKQCRSGSTKK